MLVFSTFLGILILTRYGFSSLSLSLSWWKKKIGTFMPKHRHECLVFLSLHVLADIIHSRYQPMLTDKE